MADIKDRITKIKSYFVGMQVENIEGEQVIYVVVRFPKKWFIVDNVTDKYDVTVENGNSEGEFFFLTTLENGFDTLFDAIDYNINEMEIAQERAELLQRKVYELKNLFEQEDMTMEMLRTLEFTWKGKKKPAQIAKLSKSSETYPVAAENKEKINEKGGDE